MQVLGKSIEQVKKCIMKSVRAFWSIAEKKALEREAFAMKRWDRYQQMHN